MGAHAAVLDSAALPLSHINAALNYLAPMAERPRNYTFDPPPDTPRSNAVHEAHIVPIYDLRSVAPEFSLDREGFALLRQTSAVRDFYSEEEIRTVYYPEAERVMAEATGASRVFIFDHTVRRRVRGVEDRAADTPRQPATRVHVDHTERSGPQRVRDFFDDEAETLLKGRVQVINLLASDPRSVARCAIGCVRRQDGCAGRPCSVGSGVSEPSR